MLHILLLIVHSAIQGQSSPHKIIPFTLVNNKTILSVRVGDSRSLKVILDSGMGWNGLLLFNPDLADSLHLRNPVQAQLGGGGGGNASGAVIFDSSDFSIGTFQFSNQRIVILQGESFRKFPNDGVTGYSLFGHYAVDVNYDNQTLVLYNPEELHVDTSWVRIPLFFRDNNIPWINARIVTKDEQPVDIECYVDYASSEAIELLLKQDQKFTLPAETTEYYLGRGLSGDIQGKKGKIAKVIIGPFELNDVITAFVPAEVRSKQQGADGIIANNLLRRFNLIFDYENKVLYIKPNSKFSEPF